jgi:hypothetical protein
MKAILEEVVLLLLIALVVWARHTGLIRRQRMGATEEAEAAGLPPMRPSTQSIAFRAERRGKCSGR